MKIRYNGCSPFLWDTTLNVIPLQSNLPVIVACDQSKTGYAVMVGDVSGRELSLFEMIGSGMTTEDFCHEYTEYLRRLLSLVNIVLVGYEKMILKSGMQYYNSAEVLHDIRVTTKQLFKELTGKNPIEVNNQTWKSTILPEGYRSHGEKGSLRYLREKDYFKYCDSSDNITDVACIFSYLLLRKVPSLELFCDAEEPPLYDCLIALVSDSDGILSSQHKKFKFNCEFSIEQNSYYYANRISDLGISEVPLLRLQKELDSVYKYAQGFQTYPVNKVYLVVKRC